MLLFIGTFKRSCFLCGYNCQDDCNVCKQKSLKILYIGHLIYTGTGQTKTSSGISYGQNDY